ncbi:uncharacterized protein Z519_02844 [Cladophialophora bantiana CBS 173.52]|uniref:Uncharacterized protein n=1 Tax=Cladophialophora bantiana (strain ATCC 10958 / CBS 173.52 / CDC B-1940 / NIH 8579) TaxID=1442370 RepID=A0A0D2HXW5_CLAB1|nr:uncharacterized protein Z519_02844 [Cladophialophora bantiana CBS 173.52]KIW95780.1 hypothetical protein Z519_02844 [Cladophialophora bantiana CBS 173.52]
MAVKQHMPSGNLRPLYGDVTIIANGFPEVYHFAFSTFRRPPPGTGIGGNGGRPEARVKEMLIRNAGHLIPLEKVVETAEHTVMWIGTESACWRQEDTREKEEWMSYYGQKKTFLSPEYLKHTLDPNQPAEKTKL